MKTTWDQELLDAAMRGNLERVQDCLDRGADLEVKDQYDWVPLLLTTPLVWAAYGGHTEVVRLLLDRGADIEANDKDGDTAVMWAVRNGETEVVRLLLERGANLEIQSDGMPLIWSSSLGYTEIVRLLLDRGADLELVDNEGLDAEAWAIKNGYPACADLIRAERARLALEDIASEQE